MDVLLLTDCVDRESVLPALPLAAQTVRHSPLDSPLVRKYHGIDVVIIDARTDLFAARQVCRRVATAAPQLAVVAVVSPEDVVAVELDWQLDDIVLATACTAELHTRLRLAIDRRCRTQEELLRFGDLVLHPASYAASLPNRELDLTLTEFKLLSYLVRHADRAFTRSQLMAEVWGQECSGRTVDVHVQRLRAKLGAGYETLVDTVRGVGYMAASPPQRITAVSEPIAVAH